MTHRPRWKTRYPLGESPQQVQLAIEVVDISLPENCHWGLESERRRPFQQARSQCPTVPSWKVFYRLTPGDHRPVESTGVNFAFVMMTVKETLTSLFLAARCGLTGSSNWYRHLVSVPAP